MSASNTGTIPCDKCGGPDAVIDDIVEGNLCGDCTSALVDEE